MSDQTEFPPEVVEAVARCLRRPALTPIEHRASHILRTLRGLGVLAGPYEVVAPMEPTHGQLTAAFERDMGPGEDLYRSIYRAMLAAAPRAGTGDGQ